VRVDRIVKQLIADVTPCMNQVQRKVLQASVSSLMSGASLSVTSLGRHVTSRASEKIR
jgi:hypothetical protein